MFLDLCVCDYIYSQLPFDISGTLEDAQLEARIQGETQQNRASNNIRQADHRGLPQFNFNESISISISKKKKSKMASVVALPITLTATPAGYSKPSPSKASVPKQLPIYPAGPSFISAARRQILQRSFADDDKAILEARERDAEAKANASVDGTQYPGLGEEEESQTVLSSDPKEWKKQDHYAILGLGHLRYTATDDQIKVARK